MKKIIFLILLLGVSNTTKANETEPQWKCIQDSNNFIILRPFKNEWLIITDKQIQGAKRASGIENQQGTRITSAVVESAPQGSKMYVWTNGAVENNIPSYIEPLCYF